MALCVWRRAEDLPALCQGLLVLYILLFVCDSELYEVALMLGDRPRGINTTRNNPKTDANIVGFVDCAICVDAAGIQKRR